VPGVRTEITEIVTGLAMLGYQDVQRALEVRPRHITHVNEPVFDRLDAEWTSGRFASEFTNAWNNGSAFARSALGLRGRPPWSLEWKGHHKPASKTIETIPADLRIDGVYLISCKYGSSILHNAGPVALFDHHLAPSGPIGRSDWFELIAPEAFRAVWQPVLAGVGLDPTITPSTTTKAQRELIKGALQLSPIVTTSSDYATFVDAVSQRTALRWRLRLNSAPARSELYWRLLRMQAAPYFVLGARHDGSALRYRIDTPWDFQRRYEIRAFDVTPGACGQPSVDWRVLVVDRTSGIEVAVSGHVEVRWSHGKLNGAPEAKVYLDSDPLEVPGYDAL
jgi:hypothetical protein